MKTIIAISALLSAAGAAYFFMASPDPNGPQSQAGLETPNGTNAIVQITLPDTLSANAKIGETAFQAKCAVCHGENAVGQNGVAPPLVHKIYEPSHHGDESFQRAAAQGVRSHHWKFGDMPPVEGITRGDMKMIIAYIRELQSANGIN